MRNLSLLLMSLSLSWGLTSYANVADLNPGIANSSIDNEEIHKASEPFVFIERGVEFAVFTNGEFDFAYVGSNYEYDPYQGPQRPFSYNGGYNYDMYLQFDIFGAVIQIETVPVFYDNYGRISKAGEVDISYKGENVTQIGNMNIQYKKRNAYYASRGYINLENRNLKPQPRHRYYDQPYNKVVSQNSYRENIKPVRYAYEEHSEKYDNKESVVYENGRRTFLDPVTKTPREITFKDNGGQYLESRELNQSRSLDKNRNFDQKRGNISSDRREVTRKRSAVGQRANSNSSSELRTKKTSFSQQKSNTNNFQLKQNNSSSLQSKK